VVLVLSENYEGLSSRPPNLAVQPPLNTNQYSCRMKCVWLYVRVH